MSASGGPFPPPPGLPEPLEKWSRQVVVPDGTGSSWTWHVLDSHAQASPGAGPDDAVVGTMLCVHGNPTWSYLWRHLVAEPPPGWRVIAVDQLDMGFSQRTGTLRPFARRVADLGDLTDALALTGPVVTVGHDWGGAISLGWALAHRPQLAGVVLSNTAVRLAGRRGPAVIEAVSRPLVRPLITQQSPAFVLAALVAGGRLPAPDVRAAYLAPYREAARRLAISQFVADIPRSRRHPSAAALAQVAEGLKELAGVPALLLWGPRDPVFSRTYLQDLMRALPHAEVQVYPDCGHLVPEEAPRFAADVATWVRRLSPACATSEWRTSEEGTAERGTPERGTSAAAADEAPTRAVRRPLWAGVAERSTDDSTAVIEPGPGGTRRTSFRALHERVTATAAGLGKLGIVPGDRIALLVPPGADLTVALFAIWRAGAVAVVVDAGLGMPGMRRALRSATPKCLIAVRPGLIAARAMGLRTLNVAVGLAASADGAVPGHHAQAPGQPGRSGSRRGVTAGLLGVATTLAEVERAGRAGVLPAEPASGDPALIAFTSGATGPAKGVRYNHGQLEAQRDLIAGLFEITPDDRLVAAFAPFALFGSALGITAAVPRMNLTAPATLTAAALGDAVLASGATLVFASPAALANVLATADRIDSAQRVGLAGVRALLSAGAPVPAELLRRLAALLPNAVMHTPYGMTECLTVADIDLAGLESAGAGNGVCVGHPVPAVSVRISPLDRAGAAVGALTERSEVSGEVCVRGPNVMAGYDRLWSVNAAASRDPGYHRTGDVGHLDAAGRLWIEGRLAHVITTAHGPVTPVGVERRVEALPEVRRAAAVGVGPTGAQVLVVVVETETGVAQLTPGLAPLELTEAVRASAGAHLDVVAVLVARALPVDIRHNSKIDRVRVGRWADHALAGGRVGRL